MLEKRIRHIIHVNAFDIILVPMITWVLPFHLIIFIKIATYWALIQGWRQAGLFWGGVFPCICWAPKTRLCSHTSASHIKHMCEPWIASWSYWRRNSTNAIWVNSQWVEAFYCICQEASKFGDNFWLLMGQRCRYFLLVLVRCRKIWKCHPFISHLCKHAFP